MCLPHQEEESRQVPFPTAQPVNLPACSPHCPFNAERQARRCECQFYSHWFHPTRHQTQVYSSHHSAI